APIQLAMRLLIPEGSRLLDLAEVRALVGPFDETALAYRWRHADPSLDALCDSMLGLIRREEQRKASRAEIFAKIWERAQDRPLARDFHLVSRSAVPYLTEPWYC
ncbi:MAG: radical SAM protein, partial [Chloroflexi bacterium]|nr:radical SAM protein [Chloroflexota bacterium]